MKKAVRDTHPKVQIGCVDHTIHLCVEKILEDEEVAGYIDSLRKLFWRLRKSSVDTAKLVAEQERLGKPIRGAVQVLFLCTFCAVNTVY